MVRLDDESAQKAVAIDLQQAFGKPVKSISGVKASFANPFHESYKIISTTSLIVAVIIMLVIGIISANILLNQRKDGFEILLQKGMTRGEVTLIAAEEFGMAIALPALLGVGLGVAYLFSIRGIFSIYSDFLSFTLLWKPLDLSIVILGMIIGIFLIWIISFILAFSRHYWSSKCE
ncbi:MAG: FtsX-like permease family protein [Candidatus Hodarchaeota archaeon]